MKNGDISNQIPLVVAFRFEGTVANLKSSKFSTFLRNRFKVKTTYDYNDDVLSVMERIYYRTEYTVDLVVERETYDNCKWIFEDLPYSRIIVMDKLSQVTSRILMGDITYYVDNLESNRIKVNSKYAVDLKTLSSILKFRRF